MSLTTVALIITIFACVFQTTTQESPLPVLTCVASSAETGYLHRICSHGEWPADAGTLSLPADTRYITFLYVTFQLDDAGTVAAIPGGLSNLTTLNFINTTTVTATGESTIIPFQQLVRQVDRAKITVLNFEFASFGQVDKHLLAGFTGLESLSVSQSSVLSIHPEAFEPLRFERTIVEEGRPVFSAVGHPLYSFEVVRDFLESSPIPICRS
ncbi:hypothetical protein BV898_12101 [Hypsibius exemplaris]|uniref:Receptor L-domain domain-containing protein n=1 Tax=Hypsibius exemplaris TaxID=2072580 RepID=A0A1W0WEW1_HYPEX|nr:hypothetical protein BV898_12101 [Hypsibius exemplaris]